MTWPRDAFAEAIWSSATLRSSERIVALCFADHARDKEVAFVTYPRLMQRTGLSRDTVARVIKDLRAYGWLELHETARQRRAPRYRLAIPTTQRSDGLTAEQCEQSDHLTPERASSQVISPSSQMVRLSSQIIGPDLSTDHSSDLPCDDAGPHLAPASPAELSDADRTVVEERARQLRLPVDVVAQAVRQIRASTEVRNLHAYLAKLSRIDLETKAGQVLARQAAVDESGENCGQPWHIKGGMRIHGVGADASRICPGCEALSPAAQAATLVQPPAPVVAQTEAAS